MDTSLVVHTVGSLAPHPCLQFSSRPPVCTVSIQAAPALLWILRPPEQLPLPVRHN